MAVRLRIVCPSCKRRYQLKESITQTTCVCGTILNASDQTLKRNFIADYYPHGRKGPRCFRTLPSNVKSFTDARAIAKGLHRVSKEPDSIIPSMKIIGDLKNEFLDNFIDVYKAKTTASDYRWVFNGSLKYFDLKPIQDLNDGEIRIFQKKRQADQVTNKTINKELSYFSTFLKWARDEKKISPPAPITIKMFKYERPIPQVLTHAQLWQFLDACEPYYRTLFLVTYRLGFRISETRNLRWTDINFAGNTVTIRGKGNKQRRLPLPPWLAKDLIKHKHNLPNPQTPWVFPSPINPDFPIVNVRKAMQRAKAAANISIRLTPHILRHSFATHLLKDGSNLENIRKFLGHEDIETTTIYTQVDLDDLKKAGDSLDRTSRSHRQKSQKTNSLTKSAKQRKKLKI